MLHFLKKHYPFFIFLVLCFFVYHVWIFGNGYIAAGDWPFHYPEFFREYLTWPKIWESYGSLGDVDVVAAFDVFKFIDSVLFRFVDFNFASKILYLWPIVFLSTIFNYIFLSNIVKKKLAVFIGMLVLMFNNVFLLLQGSFPTLVGAFVFMPIIFTLFKKTMENRSINFSILTSLFLFLSTLYEPRGTYIIAVVISFYFFFYILFVQRTNKRNFFQYIGLYIMPIIITGLLNIYWILPVKNLNLLSNNPLFSRGLFGNEFLNTLYAFALSHPFWTGGAPSVFVIQPIAIWYWIIPILAFLGLFLNRKNTTVVFFGFIALLGILLTKQSALPFPHLYLWLYNHIPGFNAFREASKFYAFIYISYAVLIASFVNWCIMHFRRRQIKVFSYIVFPLIIIIFLINTYPFITGKVGTLFVDHSIPSDYLILKKKLLQNPGYSRAIWTPTTSMWALFTIEHPQVSLAVESTTDWYGLSSNSSGSGMDIFTNTHTQNLFNNSSIQYVIVPLEDRANNDNFFPNYGKPRQYYINTLNKINWLKRINIGTKEIAVYENSTYRPHIYITGEKETITKNVPYKNIQFITNNPTKYTLTLRNVKEPLYVNFSESYHPDWKMRVGSFNWLSVLTDKNYFLPSKWHVKNDASLNSFYVNPQKVCQKYSCTKNSDGTYTIHATLYFAPQSYMYLGLIISGLTFLGTVGYLGFVGGLHIKRKYEKKN